ncbi:MAG: 4Fe-4S binding protein, partial [Opitutales bacterium]|nr:4Fe-4S binding protein [Opitutales bacterium]
MKNFFKAAKALRVLVALAVFCAVSAKFFDVYAALPQDFAEIPLGAQFSPSLIKMLSLGAVGVGAAFVSFTILALVFGRAYCSFFCLFGILMDILRRAALLPASIFPKSRL